MDVMLGLEDGIMLGKSLGIEDREDGIMLGLAGEEMRVMLGLEDGIMLGKSLGIVDMEDEIKLGKGLEDDIMLAFGPILGSEEIIALGK